MTGRLPTARGFETAARVCDIVGDRAGAQKWRRKAAGNRSSSSPG